MENLIHFLREYPILSSAVQVAIPGIFGEILSLRIRTGCWFFFDPVIMLFRCRTDNFVEKTPMNRTSPGKARGTLIRFRIPAHTITFSPPFHFQVSLAAIWAVALELIPGFFARSAK